jgi:ketosteroid isomerase-like protein
MMSAEGDTVATDEARAIDEVRKASAEWSEAIFTRDVAAAGRFLGAEYALMAPGLGEMPRAQWLALLPEYVVHAYEFHDVRLNAYGDVVVMRSRYSQRATVAGQDRSGSLWITDVWVNRDARWQVVARHTSMA